MKLKKFTKSQHIFNNYDHIFVKYCLNEQMVPGGYLLYIPEEHWTNEVHYVSL